jgi:hypothetical protein
MLLCARLVWLYVVLRLIMWDSQGFLCDLHHNEVANRIKITSIAPRSKRGGAVGVDDRRDGALRRGRHGYFLGTHRACRFPTVLTSVFSVTCRSMILIKLSESSGRRVGYSSENWPLSAAGLPKTNAA